MFSPDPSQVIYEKMQGNGEIGTNTRYKVRSLFIERNYLHGVLSRSLCRTLPK